MNYFEIYFAEGKVQIHRSLQVHSNHEGVKITPTIDDKIEIDHLREVIDNVSAIVGTDCDCDSHGPCIACVIKPALESRDLSNEPFGI